MISDQPSTEHLSIDSDVLVRRAIGGETGLAHGTSRPGSHYCAQGLIRCEPLQAGSKPCRISGLKQKARHAILDELSGAVNVTRHYWQAGHHGLDYDQTSAFGQ